MLGRETARNFVYVYQLARIYVLYMMVDHCQLIRACPFKSLP